MHDRRKQVRMHGPRKHAGHDGWTDAQMRAPPKPSASRPRSRESYGLEPGMLSVPGPLRGWNGEHHRYDVQQQDVALHQDTVSCRDAAHHPDAPSPRMPPETAPRLVLCVEPHLQHGHVLF